MKLPCLIMAKEGTTSSLWDHFLLGARQTSPSVFLQHFYPVLPKVHFIHFNDFPYLYRAPLPHEIDIR